MTTKFTKDDTLAVKGMAVLFLLQYHNFYPVDKFENYDVSFYPFTAETVVSMTRFLKICVAMFAFLSAYGLTLSLKKYSPDTCITGKQYAHYLKHRLPKLMWGYWFVFIFSMVICLIVKPDRLLVYFEGEGIHGAVSGVFSIAADFLGLASLMNSPTLCGTWWYMSLALFIVLIVPIIAYANQKTSFLAVTMMCIFVPRILMNGEFSVGHENNLIRWLFTIVLGVLFAQRNLLVRFKEKRLVRSNGLNTALKFTYATFAVALSWLTYVFLNGETSNYTYEIRDGIIPVLVVYYLYEFIICIPVIRTVLIFIGKHSMNIFLFSTFIRGIIWSDFTYSFRHWLLIDLSLLITSLLSSIIIELIKKYSGYDKLLDKILKCKAINKKPCE